MQYFAPQLHPEQLSAPSLRASQYRRKRKSKHDLDHDHDDRQDADSSGSDADAPPNAHARDHPSFAASELAQLRVAGLSPEEEYRVPPAPFPHASASIARPYLGSAKIQKELAGPPSRLFTVDSAAAKHVRPDNPVESTNLRRTHLNVLSTLMHRCLLQGDFDRAGRAWGMILRTQPTRGHPVDVRNHGRWAIGAEILLRRKPQGAQSTQDPQVDTDLFSEEGFELAREYYERLIVQHPTRKQAPHAVDQRHFYPAMFSLWIQQVCERSRRARQRHHREPRRSPSRSMSIDSTNGPSTEEARSHEHAIQLEERAQATEIAERLDDLVNSPPFDKQASLLHLRGAIALWISDLTVGNTAATALDEWDPYPIGKHASAAEHLANFTACQRELLTARTYLARVEENGGPSQPHSLLKIESRLKELQRQIAILRAEDANATEDW